MRELYGAHEMLEGSEQNQPDREVDPATLWQDLPNLESPACRN